MLLMRSGHSSVIPLDYSTSMRGIKSISLGRWKMPKKVRSNITWHHLVQKSRHVYRSLSQLALTVFKLISFLLTLFIILLPLPSKTLHLLSRIDVITRCSLWSFFSKRMLASVLIFASLSNTLVNAFRPVTGSCPWMFELTDYTKAFSDDLKLPRKDAWLIIAAKASNKKLTRAVQDFSGKFCGQGLESRTWPRSGLVGPAAAKKNGTYIFPPPASLVTCRLPWDGERSLLPVVLKSQGGGVPPESPTLLCWACMPFWRGDEEGFPLRPRRTCRFEGDEVGFVPVVTI